MKRIAIFASGAGSNAKNIIEYFKNSSDVSVSAILSNNPKAGVLNIAKTLGVESFVFDKTQFTQTRQINQFLGDHHIDLIVLAGFLWLIPEHLINEYPHRIINIHPALLPDFGGKGMYGHYVHDAVKISGVKESGITIHFVNGQYDQGGIIFQKAFPIHSNYTADDIASKVHQLEYKHYPKVIEQLLSTFDQLN